MGKAAGDPKSGVWYVWECRGDGRLGPAQAMYEIVGGTAEYNCPVDPSGSRCSARRVAGPFPTLLNANNWITSMMRQRGVWFTP